MTTGPVSEARLLLLMRHGKAEPPTGSDHSRALTKHGHEQATSIGQQLASQGIVPDAVLVSSAVRAQETWKDVESQLGAKPASVATEDGIYEAGDSALLDLVRRVSPGARVVMVVGHEPTISGLADLLAADGSSAAAVGQVEVGMPTASVAILEGTFASWGELEPDSFVLADLLRP